MCHPFLRLLLIHYVNYLLPRRGMFLINFSSAKPLFTDRVCPLDMVPILGSFAPFVGIIQFLQLSMIRLHTRMHYQLMGHMSMMITGRMNFLFNPSTRQVITEILFPSDGQATSDIPKFHGNHNATEFLDWLIAIEQVFHFVGIPSPDCIGLAITKSVVALLLGGEPFCPKSSSQ